VREGEDTKIKTFFGCRLLLCCRQS